MAREPHKYPDVNVFVDAAVHLGNVWQTMAPLQHFAHIPGLASKLTSAPTAHLALRQLNLHPLADCIANDTLSTMALSAWVALKGDMGAALAADPVDDPAQPSWVRHALWSSKDDRMHDLASAVEDGLLVTTSNQDRIAKRKIYEAGLPRVADRLMDALTRSSEIVPVDFSLSAAIVQGMLSPLRDLTERHAWDHLADIDPHSSTWAPRDRGGAPATSAQARRNNPERYGVDGEDLFQMLQIQLCQQHLRRRVVFITSDWHAAHAIAAIGLARSSLYLHGANESGGAKVLDLPRAIHEKPSTTQGPDVRITPRNTSGQQAPQTFHP